jgi:hypothetical protein
MNTVLQITPSELAAGAVIVLLLGAFIGYALGLADIERATRSRPRA